MMLALTFASPAVADDLKDCMSANPDLRIRACSAVINLGRESNKTLSSAYFIRGNTYDEKGAINRAINDYDNAIRLDPNFANAFKLRGVNYARKADYKRAVADYSRAIAINPKDVETYVFRAQTYSDRGDYDSAIADCDSALRLSAGRADLILLIRGGAHLKKGDFRGAIADYTRALDLFPYNAKAYHGRGNAYAIGKQYDLAITNFNLAIKLDPLFADSYKERGNAYYQTRKYDRAITDYDRAIALNPKFAEAYYNRGNAYDAQGEFNKALTDFRQALTIYPSSKKWHGEAQKRISQIEQKVAGVSGSNGIVQAASIPKPRPKPVDANPFDQFDPAPAVGTSPPNPSDQFEIESLQTTAVPKGSVLEEPAAPKSGLFDDLIPAQKPVYLVGKRVALVIGNSAYEFDTELPNPRNDARAMASMLSGMGFKVISGMDLTRREFETKIREFARAVKNSDLSLFFYAGHGLQVAGLNYLVPTDAKVEDETALDVELINAEVVTKYMGGEKKVGIVLLDACRNNPFVRSLKRSMGATRSASIGQGLAAISSEGEGLVIGYATAPGDVAADGDGINSPFTKALLKRLPTKGLEVELALKKVKADVIEATRNEQRPWTNSDLSTEVYLQPSH
ncbi:MAG: tetratricopeptide repeat protein [Hyphomicrobiales bacterium]|nr:tetratricopeptide repeat protein [Hyphomicrobiales bacterium]